MIDIIIKQINCTKAGVSISREMATRDYNRNSKRWQDAPDGLKAKRKIENLSEVLEHLELAILKLNDHEAIN